MVSYRINVCMESNQLIKVWINLPQCSDQNPAVEVEKWRGTFIKKTEVITGEGVQT